MENYEEQETICQSENIEQPILTDKVSPYADSPYMSDFTQNTYRPVRSKKQKRTGRNVLKVLVSIFLAVALVLGSVGVTSFVLNEKWQEKMDVFSLAMSNKLAVMQEQINALNKKNGSVSVAPQPQGALTPSQVYENNVDAVVAVVTDKAMGSGFLVTTDGYIISNQHVVEGASSIHVTMNNGKEYAAELIGADATNDVSLLKINADKLPYVAIGSSNQLAVGDQVAAIGNPLGELTATLTVGYVSGKDRIVSTDGTAINMLQTDAAINSGNSGGPLLDMTGKVVGITTAKYSGTSSSGASIEGISFAIPIDDVVDIVADLREFGYVKSAHLGVYVRDVDPEVVKYYGFPEGVYVIDTMPGLAAEKAGILARDIIVNIGGYDVASLTDLTKVLRKLDAGDETTITVFRNGVRVDLKIILGETPQGNDEPQTETIPETTNPDSNSDFFGDWWNDFPFFGWD